MMMWANGVEMRQFFLFAYDIGCPKRQAKVRRLLQGYATGSQKSLFECWVTPDESKQLYQQIQNIIQENDVVHFFRLPENVEHSLFGTAKPLRYDYFIIA
ncbi:CRISPR-associated endonuclease Cas2 [Kingella negevensis]|uniref:CRISPR-associated endoribonuclease Cas2 n=2 Tax=Kingella negevensis TaxID=1522312 RepID=A0A238HHQ3_9NEIS|nr:CRISPR-associated endonuclease Cas2 [Kingella negevensis]MDK4681157.1 CRISPR-associated endonuclease Cas2 [Kingella negevensis]MDK4683360.1 CRISPR-associated endonuclease Cas2 [Kingella negevensis]MDK4691510.1 CRISPR-associated endonuclease Cas2 [Kingella negevensis]MDK4693339.1 CRISPR-associated endonuclease Cas2 [Kingella negevensis]MDK4697630.1 CRISPR-associated endonuclease Cas2 [Kingella negevensis]